MATTTAQKRQELLGLGAVNVNLERLATTLGLPAELGPLINESIQGGIGTVDTMAGTIELKPSWKNAVKQGLRIVDVEIHADVPLAVVVNFPKELKVLFPNVQSSYRVFIRTGMYFGSSSESSQVTYDKGYGSSDRIENTQRYIMGALTIPPPIDPAGRPPSQEREEHPDQWKHFIRNRTFFKGSIQGIQYNQNTTLNRTRSGRERFTGALNAVEAPFVVFESGAQDERRVSYNAQDLSPNYNSFHKYEWDTPDLLIERDTAELVERIRLEGTLTVQVTNELINVRNRYFDNDEGVEIVLSYDKRKGTLSIYIEMVSKPMIVYKRGYGLRRLDNATELRHYEPRLPTELIVFGRPRYSFIW